MFILSNKTKQFKMLQKSSGGKQNMSPDLKQNPYDKKTSKIDCANNNVAGMVLSLCL